MPHFKAFPATADSLAQVERQINAWMAEERPRILFYAQGTAPVMQGAPLERAGLVFSFVYERAGDALGALAATESAAVPEGIEHSLDSIDLDPSDPDITLLPEAELPY